MPDFRDLVLADFPLGFWELDATSGSAAVDSSPNELGGAVSGSPVWQQAALSWNGVGHALKGDPWTRVTVAGLPNFSACTIEWWASGSVPAPTYSAVWSIYLAPDGTFDDYVQVTRDADFVRIFVRRAGTAYEGGWPASADPAVYALVVSGTSALLLINGVPVVEVAFGSAGSWGGAAFEVFVGGDGVVDDIALWPSALTLARLEQHATVVPPDPIPVEYAHGSVAIVTGLWGVLGQGGVPVASGVVGASQGAVLVSSAVVGESRGFFWLWSEIGAVESHGAVGLVSSVGDGGALVVEADLSLWVAISFGTDGLGIDFRQIEVSSGALSHRNGDALWGATLVLADPEDAAWLPVGVEVWVDLPGRSWWLMVDGLDFEGPAPAVSDRLSVRLVGYGARLGGDWSSVIDRRFPDRAMASELAYSVLPDQNIAWGCVDWLVEPFRLDGDASPLEIAGRLTTAVGAVLEQLPEGNWLARPLLVSPSELAVSTPAAIYTDADSTVGLSSSIAHYRGCNAVRVRDADLSDQDRIEYEPDTSWGWSGLVRFYPSPWRDPSFSQTTPGTLIKVGDTVREVEELVEFEGGSGTVQYPVEGVLNVEWISVELGAVEVYPYRSELMVEDAGWGVALVTYQAHSHDLRLEAPTDAIASQLLYELGSGAGAVAVECYRGAGDRVGDDVVDALLCTEGAAIARGRYELDADTPHRLWRVDVPLDVSAACGSVVDWIDGGVRRRGIVGSVEHTIPDLSESSVATTRLEVREYAA